MRSLSAIYRQFIGNLFHEFCKGEVPGGRTINSTIKDSRPFPKIVVRERNFKEF